MKMPDFTTKMLVAIFLLALTLRFVPVLIAGVPVGLDSYLHIDIALRILEKGTLLSFDPLSLVGLKAYSYPPGFHVILAAFLTFLPPVAGSHFVGALLGALSVFFIFRISQEIFRDDNVSLFSALFFATSPIHIFRTSMPIPEGFGVLLFTVSLLYLIRYLKTKHLKYLAITAGVFVLYIFSHRGASLFLLSALLLLVVYYSGVFRKRSYLFGMLAFIAVAYYGITTYMSDLLSRINVEAVTALGYIKWMGTMQLFFAAVGVILLYKTKDRLKLFLIVWAALLLVVGSFSFRFRDPYAAIPLSLLAGYAVIHYVIPEFRKNRKVLKAVLGFVILFTVGQALYTSLYVVEYPTPGEIEALMWIKENTPEDSIILTWKEEGYYIMGVTERKDILTWKRIYQGFFEEPPSVDEAKAAYIDMFVMFRSANKDWMLSLMKRYDVDYIYIDSRMRLELDALKYGLVDYLSYDTYFEPVFANDMAEIYRFVEEPMMPQEYSGKFSDYAGFRDYRPTFDRNMTMSLIPYLEEYWNGMSYLDSRDYRSHYSDITEIIRLMLVLDRESLTGMYHSRAEWLLEWLAFQQLVDGGFLDQKYENPKKSAATTCLVVSDLIDIYREEPEMEGPSVEKGEELIMSSYNGLWIKTVESSIFDDYRTDAVCLPALWKLGQTGAARQIEQRLLMSQKNSGAWPYGEFSDRSTVNSQTVILEALIEYYELSGSEEVRGAVVRGARWLSTQQSDAGKFWNYVVPETGRVIKTEQVTYPKAGGIYDFAGMEGQKQLTLDYISENYDPDRDDLEALVQIMSDNL
ncbi:MAG: glycosyltransferase family 39 protein [Candidatus Aenigmatarchaeota archaeon]|nr:MAG: glycosyltransferase family 39 protein [Candidatus Aenigmarchaeota archaeon]